MAIRQLTTGELITTVQGFKDGEAFRINFKSKAVVMSTGGKASIPKEISEGIPESKLILADDFLRKDGYNSFMQTLVSNPAKRKIVIIGGSHSGFSAAWVLLRGPAVFNHNKNG